MEPGDSARAAEIILEKLGLDGTEIDQLKQVPYEQLIEVATEALEQVSEETGRSVKWRPTKDGEYILNDWADFADDIPLMIGTVFSENSGTLHLGTGKNEWTEEEIEANLIEAFGEDKDAVVEEFTRLYPDKPVQDVLYYNNRSAVLENVRSRMAATDAPVYRLSVQPRTAGQRRHYRLPLLRADICLPQCGPAGMHPRDRRHRGLLPRAGSGGAGVDQFRGHGKSQPGRSGMEPLDRRGNGNHGL